MGLLRHHALWLIHTAGYLERERDREWEWERDREQWVYIICYVLYKLHRDREREWGPMGSIPSPVPVQCEKWLIHTAQDWDQDREWDRDWE